MSPDEVCRDDLMWLSGYLEGEGCFTYHSVINGIHKYPFIVVDSTDYDVIERVKQIMGVSKIYTIKFSNPNYLTAYRVKVNGALAIAWMNKLLPFMGIRRKSRIDKILLNLGSTRNYRKLNYEIACSIREIYKENVNITQKELATMFGVGQTLISKVINNKVYVKGDAD